MAHFCVACFCCAKFSFFSTKPRDWPRRTPWNDPFLCRMVRKTLIKQCCNLSVRPSVSICQVVAPSTGPVQLPSASAHIVLPRDTLLAICRCPGGCTVASGVVGVGVVVVVCNCSQMRTSKCTCLIFGVSIGLDPG